MPRIQTIKTNFTAGELSARLRGRVDIARYQNGADILENAIPLVQGGVVPRPGLRFITPAKNDDKRAILVPFVFNNDQSYMLEFGDLYMRVFKDRAQVEETPGVPYEIDTTFTEDMLSSLTYAQRGDTLFVASGSQAIQRIRRYTDTAWIIESAPIDPIPFDEVGFFGAATLTLSAATVGVGRTFTAGSAVFLGADVGRQIWADTGIATITGFTDTTHVTCEITTPFVGTAIASGAWQMRDSPRTTCTPSLGGPVGAGLTLTLGGDGWRTDDVGKHVEINLGLCKITGYTSAVQVSAVIVKVLSGVAASPSEAWSLEGPVWNASLGYPKAVALYQQALYVAGSLTYPVTVWRSKVGQLLEFTMGTDDSDAMSYNIDAAGQDQIYHLFPMKTLMVLTGGNGFSMYGGVEKPITPTNTQVDNASDRGSSEVRPLRIGKDLVFSHRAGKKLYAIAYDLSSDDSFSDTDLSLLSSHITEVGITDMAYQQEPESVLFMTLEDGTFATLTVDKKQEVFAWARQSTDGEVEAIATIPSVDGNETWCIVKRTIDGNTVRYVEIFDDALRTDCSVTGTEEAGATVWAGLDHIEGKTVDIVADGSVMSSQVVVGGEVTLEREAFEVEIGLHYSPRIKTLPLELSTSTGTLQGTNQSINKIWLRVLDTYGATINDQYIDFRKFGDSLLDLPPPAFTGDVDIEALGWSYGAQVDIRFDLPLKFHLLGVITQFTSNT